MPEALTIVSRSSKDGIGATTESTISSSSIIREPISSQVPLSPQNIPHCHHKISQMTLQITLITHTHPFNGPFSGTTRVSRYQKGKPIWILLKQETVSGSGINWAVASTGLYASLHLAPARRPCSTPSLSFLQAGCPSCRPTNSIKALKASTSVLIIFTFSSVYWYLSVTEI